jgi:dUTP pyrophosphatase
MERDDIEDYINNLKRIEKSLNDDDSFDLSYIGELDKLLSKLKTDVTQTSFEINENPNEFSGYFNLKIKVKKLHNDAVIPKYSKDGDAGMDLTATEILNETTESVTYGTGLAFEIPKGYVGLVFPRSSIRKYDLALTNCVGVIDSGYRGEVQATFKKTNWSKGDSSEKYNVGDRIAQIIILPYPKITLIETEELSNTERGEGGFGSTGT